MKPISYRSLHKYKYQLMEGAYTKIFLDISETITGANGFVCISPTGKKGEALVEVEKGYCWDGCSGPTVDTKTSMRASLFHDAFYQLMREAKLPYKFVGNADRIFYRMLKEDGMNKFRAWYYYKGVNTWFAHRNARPRKK